MPDKSGLKTIPLDLTHAGGERTSQSRDQNIEIEYKLGNFVSLRTGKIDFFNTLVVPLRKIASAKYENNFVLVIFA